MTCLIATSDTHGKEFDPGAPVLGRCDILIHCGDATVFGNGKEFLKALRWFDQQQAAHKIFVPGNHDLTFDPAKKECLADPDLPRRRHQMFKDHGVTVLIDQMIEIDGLKIWGTPWVPNLPRWAFHGSEIELDRQFSKIPEGVDILVSHGPAHGILDGVPRHTFGYPDWIEPVGSHTLGFALNRVKTKLHLFGHIHEAYGAVRQGGTLHCNVAMCDATYSAVNPPMIIRIDENGVDLKEFTRENPGVWR